MTDEHPHTAELVDATPDRRVGPRETSPPDRPAPDLAGALALLDAILGTDRLDRTTRVRLQVLRNILQPRA